MIRFYPGGWLSQVGPMPGMLTRLTAARCHAALVVFLFHALTAINWAPLRVVSMGQIGMPFFFMLSGVVLTWSWRPEHRALEFWLRRFARIYPPMIVMTVLVALGAVLCRGAVIITGTLGLVTSCLGFRAWFPTANPALSYDGVCWSLSVEVFLYLCFPVLVAVLAHLSSRARLSAVLAGAVVTCTVTCALNGVAGGWVIALTNPLLRVPEFCLGIVVALELRAGRRLRVNSAALLPLTLTAAVVGGHIPFFLAGDYVVMIPFALQIVALMQADLDGRTGFLTTRLMVYLGSLSFAFYLVHYLVITTTVIAFGWQGPWSYAGGLVPLTVVLVFSLVAAAALHHGVEVPCERFLRRHGLRLLHARARRAAAARELPAVAIRTAERAPATT